MGAGGWSQQTYENYARQQNLRGSTVHETYRSRHIHRDLDPKHITVRESRDSTDNPESTAIIIALDVTGSMDRVNHVMAKEGINGVMSSILERKPVTNPHLMCMGIGDLECDETPLQVTQFEADIRIQEQTQKIFLERGGGGNHFEGYSLAWLFAAARTSIDCFEKRQKKGYLFTIGDDGPTRYMTLSRLHQIWGSSEIPRNLDTGHVMRAAAEKYHLFHVLVAEGGSHSSKVEEEWREILGNRALMLTDHTKLSEVIVSAMLLNEGQDVETVSSGWSGDVRNVVRRSVVNYGGRFVDL